MGRLGPIENFHGEQISGHRGQPGDITAGDIGVFYRAKIAHDRGLGAVIEIDIAAAISGHAIIRPGMAKPQRMANFMQIGGIGIAVDCGAICGQPTGAYIDRRLIDDASIGIRRIRPGKGAGKSIIKYDLRVGGCACRESDTQRGLPAFQRPLCQLLPGCCQPGDIIGDDITGGGVKMYGGRDAPGEFANIRGDFIQGEDVGGDMQIIVTRL